MAKKNFINRTHIEGLLYQHSLELKVSGPDSKKPGTQYITGVVEIATDDQCLNIVPVHYTYVTEKTSTGKTNASYGTLLDILNGNFKSIMQEGKENAAKLRIDSAIGLNEFYSDRNGQEELVSVKRNEGGFIHLVTNALDVNEKVRNTFKVDMVITNCIRKEADEEKQIPEKVIVKGAIFDFRNSLLPVEFSAIAENAMDYFESLGASNSEPVFTQVWGRQLSTTIVNTITTESAFGEPSVREVKSTRKDFVITGAAKEPYIWDDDDSITIAEFTKAIQDRETYLATLKERNDEYKAKKAAGEIGQTPTNAVKPGEFNF